MLFKIAHDKGINKRKTNIGIRLQDKNKQNIESKTKNTENHIAKLK